ncbi:MAG: tetratricopeptide repeat protein [Candidatus Omnitrophica bacterium]|nr:tetratricopeptide repeat protein [Candidatus Omnitrophota bacterium]
MSTRKVGFFKRTYKVFLIIIIAVVFFLGYNIYLVDRSLLNLRIALDKVNNVKTLEDASKFVALLDYALLEEVASPELKESNISKISKIELAKDILTNPQTQAQLEDAKYALREAIKVIEQDRPTMLAVLDAFGKVVTGDTETSPEDARAQVRRLESKLAVSSDPQERQKVCYALGNAYTRFSDFEAAKKAYQDVIDIDPEAGLAKKAHFNLAWNEKQQGNFDAAIVEFEALAQEGINEEFLYFSKYQMAESYRKKGDYKKAIEIFESIAGQKSTGGLSEMSSLQVASTFLYNLNEPEQAQQAFERAKERFQEGSIAKHIDDNAQSSIASRYQKDGFALLQEGFEGEDKEKYKQAIAMFDKALLIEPRDGRSYVGKGMAYFWLKDPDRALGYAKEGVKLLPEDEVAYVNLAYIYIELDILDEALIVIKKLIAANPFTATGYYNLGYVYALKDDLEEAKNAFRQATIIDPTMAKAFNNFGWTLWETGKFSEASVAFERAVELKSDYLDALFNLGTVYKTLGRNQEAKDSFDLLIEKDPDSLYPEARSLQKALESLTAE